VRRLLFQSGDDRAGLSAGFSSPRCALAQQRANDHEIVGEHRGANKQGEALATRGAATLHATAAHQHRNAALDAGAKALARFERRRSFVGLALRRLVAAALRNADHGDGALHAGGHVVLAEEAAIRAIKVRAGWMESRRKARRWHLSEGAT
jgi:hypothetical protein